MQKQGIKGLNIVFENHSQDEIVSFSSFSKLDRGVQPFQLVHRYFNKFSFCNLSFDEYDFEDESGLEKNKFFNEKMKENVSKMKNNLFTGYLRTNE